MADGDDSLDRFRGQPWSNWTDFLGRESPISDEEDPNRPEPDCMRLPREDMGLYGLCPEVEKFYLVICEVCEMAIKPQGLVNHYEKRHKTESKDALPPPEPPEKVNSKGGTSKGASSKLNATTAKVKVKRPVSVVTKADRAVTNIDEPSGSTDTEKISIDTATSSRQTNQASTSAGSSSGTLLQPVVALTPLGSPRSCSSPPLIVKQTSIPSTTTSSVKSSHVSTLKLPHASSSSTTSLKSTSASASPSTLPNSAADSSSSSFSAPVPSKKRLKVERKSLPVKEREYDPDKHCGVWNGENSKPCTHSLTCKSHTLSMRRAVSGRSKHFDKLLADHKAAKDASAKVRSSASQSSCQSTPMEVETSQALSPTFALRTGGVVQQEVPASPKPTSLSTPMTATVITTNSTPAASSAPVPSVTSTPYHGTLATTPLPSLPNLSEDSFEAKNVPVPVTKTPLLSSVTISKDHLGLGLSPGPPQTTISVPSPSIPAITTSVPTATPAAPPIPVTVLSPVPSQSPAVPTTVGMEVSFIVSCPVATTAATTKPVTAPTVPLAVTIPKPVVPPLPAPVHTFRANNSAMNAPAVQMCDIQTLFKDMTWLKHHPRPLAVCTFGGRKVGALVCKTRKCEVVREGLKKALASGPTKVSHGTDTYGKANRNILGGTLKPVLRDICKSGYVTPSGKILIPTLNLNKSKLPLLHTPLHCSSVSSSLSSTLSVPTSLKAVLPKPQHVTLKSALSQGLGSRDTARNGQFHVPNILSGSLKRQGDPNRMGGNIAPKRTKRKHPSNVNPAEIIGNLLARMNSRVSGRGGQVPLVTATISNGLSKSSTSQSDTSDTKKPRTTELQKSATTGTQITDASTSATNVKVVSPNVQNVRIAAAPSTVQLATPQIAYLATGPVTFQQIPVLSPQVISQIQLQSKSSSSGQSIPLKLVSGSGGVSLATAPTATATRTMVIQQDKDHSSSES